jgi:hypothetical protein
MFGLDRLVDQEILALVIAHTFAALLMNVHVFDRSLKVTWPG